MTLVDTNILLDVITEDRIWADWSEQQLNEAAVRGAIAINEVVYAETSARYTSVDEFESVLEEFRITYATIPRAALFAAGQAFVRYRRAGGVRTGVPSDFFIGAHAAIEELPLLTRDVTRYRAYFPNIQLIAPDSTN